MNKIPNRAAICQVLMEQAKTDRDIIALCSDSRGSASMAPFFEAYPQQSVEVGIAEQNLVSIAAGMAKCGKKPFAFSPACFLSTRSYEQAKVDVAYSNTNVKLIGISGGISYGELGMSHHSAQDIAAMSAIPNMRVYLPSDRFQTAELIRGLLQDRQGAYVRVGRNPVEDIYDQKCPFVMDRAVVVENGDVAGAKDAAAWIHGLQQAEGEAPHYDAAIIACGEMVAPALEASRQLAAQGKGTIVLDMYCLKPLDREAVITAAGLAERILTIEEHAPFGGLGSMVSSVVAANCPKQVISMALPDAPVITGKSPAVFAHYGLNAEGIVANLLKY